MNKVNAVIVSIKDVRPLQNSNGWVVSVSIRVQGQVLDTTLFRGFEEEARSLKVGDIVFN